MPQLPGSVHVAASFNASGLVSFALFAVAWFAQIHPRKSKSAGLWHPFLCLRRGAWQGLAEGREGLLLPAGLNLGGD